MDALLGRTIFQFKSDLRLGDGRRQKAAPDHLRDRQQTTRTSFVGIATDGARLRAFELRRAEFEEVTEFSTQQASGPKVLQRWLESTVAVIPLF